MKHRHRLQQQRHKAASRNKTVEVDEAADEQPSSSRAKKRVRHHEMAVEGKRPRARLDKYARGNRRPKRYDDGGVAAGSSSPRNPDDPGGEIGAANKARKSTADWIRDEIMGGTRPAYARGGRQRPRHYDAGGAAPPGGGVNFPPAPSGADFIRTPRQNPVVAFVQRNIPPLDRNISLNPKPVPLPNLHINPLLTSGSKAGGRIHRNRGKEK